MSDNSHSGLVKVDDWGKIITIPGQGGGVILPFNQEIFLFECHIAGTMYVDKIKEKTADIIEGTELNCCREPDNKSDALAITVQNANGEKIGYLPRAKNEVVARLMDGGKIVFGRVVTKDATASDWLKITIRVFMKDF